MGGHLLNEWIETAIAQQNVIPYHLIGFNCLRRGNAHQDGLTYQAILWGLTTMKASVALIPAAKCIHVLSYKRDRALDSFVRRSIRSHHPTPVPILDPSQEIHSYN